MRAYPVAFTSSGQLKMDDGTTVIEGDQLLCGLTVDGFTSVKVYSGTDATGDLLLVATASGVTTLDHELYARGGVYVAVAGTGKGTVWLAG